MQRIFAGRPELRLQSAILPSYIVGTVCTLHYITCHLNSYQISEFQGLDAQGRPAVAMICLGCLGQIDRRKLPFARAHKQLQQDGAWAAWLQSVNSESC
jgi:hypothetical protein